MTSTTAEGRRLKLAFLGDMNSIHVRKWIEFIARRGHDVSVLSSHWFDPARFQHGRVVNLVPKPDNRASRLLAQAGLLRAAKRVRNALNSKLPDEMVFRRAQRQIDAIETDMVGYYDRIAREQADRVADIIQGFRAEVFQSLRLYPEGLFARKVSGVPWNLMAWGQCISLWADRYPFVAELTREAVTRSTFYMVDNMRDIHDARRYGLRDDQPWHITPSGGGVETGKLHRNSSAPRDESPVFMTFRRTGGSFINNLPVIRAIGVMHRRLRIPARFIIHGDQSGPHFEQVRIEAKRCGVADYVEVRPPFAYADVANVLSRYDLVVSAATFDGTTNALLETMWLGGIPLNGDLPPLREWIDHGQNGYLFDLNDPDHIASVFAQALEERSRHDAFRERNRQIILERAEYDRCMSGVESIYFRMA